MSDGKSFRQRVCESYGPRDSDGEAAAEIARLREDLNIARACKPDEFTHVLASERLQAQRAARAEAALKEIRDAKQRWVSGAGSYCGGETNAAFATRLQRIAEAALKHL